MLYNLHHLAVACLAIAQVEAGPLKLHRIGARYELTADVSGPSEAAGTASTPRPIIEPLTDTTLSIAESLATAAPTPHPTETTTSIGLTLIPIDGKSDPPPVVPTSEASSTIDTSQGTEPTSTSHAGDESSTPETPTNPEATPTVPVSPTLSSATELETTSSTLVATPVTSVTSSATPVTPTDSSSEIETTPIDATTPESFVVPTSTEITEPEPTSTETLTGSETPSETATETELPGNMTVSHPAASGTRIRNSTTPRTTNTPVVTNVLTVSSLVDSTSTESSGPQPLGSSTIPAPAATSPGTSESDEPTTPTATPTSQTPTGSEIEIPTSVIQSGTSPDSTLQTTPEPSSAMASNVDSTPIITPTLTEDPNTSVEIQPTGKPDAKVPTVVLSNLPTQSSAVPTNAYQKNLNDAKKFNKVFETLTPQSACQGSQVACINGQQGNCNANGAFDLLSCPGDQKCFALPMANFDGIVVGCANVDDAKVILDGGKVVPTNTPEGPETFTTPELGHTTPVQTNMAPTPTSEVSQKPSSTILETTEAEPEPIVTRTTTITIDAPTPEPPVQSTRAFPAAEPPVSSVSTEAPQINTPAAPHDSPAPGGFFTYTQSIKAPDATTSQPEGAEPTSVVGPPQPNPTSLVLIPLDDPSSMATAAAEGEPRTTQVVNGTPTVSVYFTVTVTEKERETVTLLVNA